MMMGGCRGRGAWLWSYGVVDDWVAWRRPARRVELGVAEVTKQGCVEPKKT